MTTARIPAHWQRSRRGTKYRVKAYVRTHRKKGHTFRYKDVGRYQVRFDDLGNFRGSRVLKDRPARWISKTPARRRASS